MKFSEHYAVHLSEPRRFCYWCDEPVTVWVEHNGYSFACCPSELCAFKCYEVLEAAE